MLVKKTLRKTKQNMSEQDPNCWVLTVDVSENCGCFTTFCRLGANHHWSLAVYPVYTNLTWFGSFGYISTWVSQRSISSMFWIWPPTRITVANEGLVRDPLRKIIIFLVVTVIRRGATPKLYELKCKLLRFRLAILVGQKWPKHINPQMVVQNGDESHGRIRQKTV